MHYFGKDEVEVVFSVDYWVLLHNGDTAIVRKEMGKRLLLDECCSRNCISLEMEYLARGDFVQRGHELLLERPDVTNIYEVVLKDFLLQNLPPSKKGHK